MSFDPQAESPPDGEWRETFTEICDRYRGRLIRWVTAIFGPRDAEDIAQETLARLYCRPDLVQDGTDAWPWLAVVSRNLGRDLARHNALSTTVDAVALAQVAAPVVVPDEVIARDEGERLARALRGLSPRERSVIRLRDFEGASIGDIAELLGISENAVRQQLFRARRRLATVYVDLGGDSRIGGLVAAFGLRLREAARRYSPFAEGIGVPSAAALSASLPAIAAVLGGIASLVPGIGDDATRGGRPGGPAQPAAFAARWDARDQEVRHGTGNRPPAAATAPHRERTRPPVDPVRIDQEVPGVAGVDATVGEGKFGSEEGRYNYHYIYVDIPVLNERVSLEGWNERPGGGGGRPTVCRLPVVKCGT